MTPATPPNLRVSNHPLALHKLTILRNQKTEPKKFREVVRELGHMLIIDATADLPLNDESIVTPMGATMGEGALSRREKALIALAVAHTVQCPYCIDAYTKGSLEAGADLDQMTEAVHVAAAIKGGAALVHGVQMLEHHDEVAM